jgi:mannose-6-phosphate isomerase-like protein (cupin superfamily)
MKVDCLSSIVVWEDRMVKKSPDMEKEVRERMRDGMGKVEIIHLFKKEELKGKVRLLARLVLKKDCSIGFHRHEGEEEIFYIISGKGIVDDNGTSSSVKAGDAVVTGGGAGHSIMNRDDEPLEILAVILLYA